MLDAADPKLVRKYNEAAEHYFRTIPHARELLEKPFLPYDQTPATLLRVAILLEQLHLLPGHVVLDFGAGTGWLSLMLARMTFRAVAVDVSEAALELGREAFEASGIPADRLPSLLHYDGHHLPLPDASMDRIACFDAMHHVPNKSEVLREMHRVLRNGGIACLAEPGQGHAHSSSSRSETESYGVLEDEVPPLEFGALALACGFTSVQVIPFPALAALSLDDYRRFEQGDPGPRSDRPVIGDALIILRRGHADSHLPDTLRARIEVLRPLEPAPCGGVMTVAARVTNSGDTIWRAVPPDGDRGSLPLDYDRAFLDKRIPLGRDGRTPEEQEVAPVELYRRYLEHHRLKGFVALGAHLLDVAGELLDRDYGRAFLPGDLFPGQSAVVELRLRAPASPGLYRLELDMVDEYVTWFGSCGSEPTTEVINVHDGAARHHDSRRPQRLLAELTLLEREEVPGGLRLLVKAANVGDTAWIDAEVAGGGRVQLGLQTLDSAGQVLVRDWARFSLHRIVVPGDEVLLDVRIPPPGPGGLKLDMVAEGVAWFEDRGSRALTQR